MARFVDTGTRIITVQHHRLEQQQLADSRRQQLMEQANKDWQAAQNTEV